MSSHRLRLDLGIMTDAAAVTPSDGPTETRYASLYIGVAGDVAIETEHGSTVTFIGCLAGTILPVRNVRVLATGTTAASLVGLSHERLV